MSTPAKMAVTLIDGELMQQRHPDTFTIPSALDRANVVPGDYVKIGFVCPELKQDINSERMWVCVTGDGIGYLDNAPVVVPMQHGAYVAFAPRHILAIHKGDSRH